MKTLHFSTLIGAPYLRLLILAMATGAVRPVASQQPVNVRHAVAADASVRMSGDFASLRIIAWDRDSVVITGTVPKGARLDGGVGPVVAKQAARGAKFYVEQSQGTASATLELYVPARARVWAKTANATIEATGSTGGLDLNVIGGSIVVRASPAELNIESMDGTVEVTGSPAWIRVKTASGAITMRGSSDDAAFTSVSGDVGISEGRFDRIRIETVTGNASFTADQARGSSLTADSHSGLLELGVSKASGVDIDAISIAGSIENRITRRQPIPGRQGRGQELALQVGDASARAVLRSFKGSIRLVMR